MIPNVRKGGDMYGLINYLQGEGRANEHENPHVVAGDDFLTAWYATEGLEKASVKEITDYLEEPRRLFGTKVTTQVSEQDPETGAKRVTGYKDAHVWHCSLSLSVEEGNLGDERWQTIADDFMDEMGFTEASGKAPCRWVAIHHGVSSNGNDHIHIAASLVREDGTRWDGRYLDFKRAQEACRELEAKHGLMPVEGSRASIAERGEQPAERYQAARAGLERTAPKQMAEQVRSAAVASSSEAEWIRRVRAEGVVLKPVFAKGSTDVITGYRAALKPDQYGGKLAFYGGGTLGKDLSLPRLREGWEAPTLEQAQEASAEWQAAFRGKPPATAGRESRKLAPTAPQVAAEHLGAMNARLGQIPLHDREGWSRAASDISGALSAWAKYDKTNATELRSAAAVVARSAQVRRPADPSHARGKASSMATAFLFAAAKPKDRTKIAAARLVQELARAAAALRDYHRAAGHLRQAQSLHTEVVQRLERIPFTGYMQDQDSQPVQAMAARNASDAQTPGQRTGTTLTKQQGFPLPRPLAPPRRPEHVRTSEGERDVSR